jgi:hypothetical protein
MDLKLFEGTGLTEPYEVVRTLGFRLLGTSGRGETITVDARLDVIRRFGSTNYEAMLFATNPSSLPALILTPFERPIAAETVDGVVTAFLERRREAMSTIGDAPGSQQKPPDER